MVLPAGVPPSAQFPYELLLKVHIELSKVIAPATAITLETSEPSPKQGQYFGGFPFIVKFAAGVAFVCAILFVVTTTMLTRLSGSSALAAARVEAREAETKAQEAGAKAKGDEAARPEAEKRRKEANDLKAKADTMAKAEGAVEKSDLRKSLEDHWGLTDDGLIIFNAFFGAALGAAFYILIKTHPCLLTRSFDPKFNFAYASRFMIGVVAGVLLATILKKFIQGQGTGVVEVTPSLLAILGGYAAEFVEESLQRLVEMLLAAIRGDGKAQATAAAKEQNVEVRNKLVDLEKAKDDPGAFKKALAEIHAALKTDAR